MFKKIEEDKAAEFISKADLKKSKKSKKKSETYVAVYLTMEEKEKLLSKAEEKGLSASSFIRIILKDNDII